MRVVKVLKSEVWRKSLRAVSSLILVSLSLATLSNVTLATAASAAVNGSEPSLWLGAAGGLMVPNKSGTSARSDFGITAGAMIGSELAVGAYYLTSKKTETSVVGTFDLDFYGVEGSYHFEGEARGAYFGARLGITKMAFGVSPNDVTASPFHLGVFAGYNKWIMSNLSLGADLGVYSVSKGEATSLTGVTSTVDPFTALTFLATLKFWL